MLAKWLFRLGVGAAAAVLLAVQQYLPLVDTAPLGVWAPLVAVVFALLAKVLGDLAAKLPQ